MWALNEGFFAIKESVAEYYRREFMAGRFSTVLPERGQLMELYAADVITDNQINQYTPILATETKSGLVAVISVVGVMTRFGQACSYGTDRIIQTIAAANADPRISAIVIRWATPGGEVAGTKALADAIYNSQKVIVSWVSQADSAGFWGAVQAKEVIMEDSADAEVGSIGVYSVHVDEQKSLEQAGIKITIIRADGSEDKSLSNPYEDLPAEVLAERKATATAIRAEFVQQVKTARPNISDEVFTGKTYRLKDALKYGMADRAGSLQDAIARADFLSRKVNRANQNSNNNNNKASEEMGFFSDLLAKHKPADSAAAELLAEQEVAAKDAKIKELEAAANSAKTEAETFKAKVAELEPKAKKFEEIKDEHAANADYVRNLKEAGITPPKAGGDANASGEAPKKSYEKAAWNAAAIALKEQLNA